LTIFVNPVCYLFVPNSQIPAENLNVKDVFRLVGIEVRESEDIQVALRRFKKKCIEEGIPQDIRKNAFYEKPSVRKRNKHKRALKRLRRKMMKFQRD
jgi:small subunit ribosomal protein S21